MESGLVLLLSSMWLREEGEKKNPKQRQEGMRDGYHRKTKGVFIACEASHGYNNGRHFDSRTSTRVCHFENRASCAGYPDSQAKCSTF
jgi:hypothetical protein